jgi:ATP-binding cassette subfamily C (CFTR/MRP) protein 1
MATTDERVKLMNELLAGIRIVKFSAWEEAFSKQISQIRQKELQWVAKRCYSLAIGVSLILNAVPAFLPILVFYTFVRLGNDLTSSKAFVTISLFNLIRMPLVQLPGGEKMMTLLSLPHPLSPSK